MGRVYEHLEDRAWNLVKSILLFLLEKGHSFELFLFCFVQLLLLFGFLIILFLSLD